MSVKPGVPSVTARNTTLNTEHRLYVIPCRGGYTCLGFDVCDKWGGDVLAWLSKEAPAVFWQDASLEWHNTQPGTLERYAAYEAIMNAGGRFAIESGKRCLSDLTPQLIGLEGHRVEVTHSGEKRRFIVGKSTGWRPCHLEIARRNSSGGGCVTLFEGDTVRDLGRVR